MSSTTPEEDASPGTLATIGVGFDASEGALEALRWASALAEGADASITAVSAFPAPAAELTVEKHRELRANFTESLYERGLPGNVAVDVTGGDPRNVLSNVSVQKDFDLLVLGRIGRIARPGFLHVGSVVEYVVHHTNTPLAVIANDSSRAKTPDPGGPIVVGLDGSPGAAAAATLTASIAAALGRDVVAASILQPHSGTERAAMSDAETRTARARLDQWSTPLTSAGIATTTSLVIDTDPAIALLELAESVDAALLVVGTRGTGGFTGLRMGGVAMRALHRSPISLVVVPPTR